MFHEKLKKFSRVVPQDLETATNALATETKEIYTPIGSSCSGRVIAIGNQVKAVRVGDWVACFGQEHAYHADVISAPEHCIVKIPDKKCLKISSLIGYGARAMHIVHGAHLMIGEIVAVFIHDLFGLLVAQLCKKAGARVVAILPNNTLHNQAEQSRLDSIFYASDETLIPSIALLTGNHGVDVTLIPSYHPNFGSCDPALITRKKGRVLYGAPIQTSHTELALHKELKYHFFSTYGAGSDEICYERGCDYPIAHVRWTEKRNAEAFIQYLIDTPNDDLYAFPECAVDDLEIKKNSIKQNPLALYLTYCSPHGDTRTFTVKPAVQDGAALHTVQWVRQQNTLRIGIVGAPKFSQPSFFSNLVSVKNAKITAIADDNSTDALNLAHACGAEHTYRTLDELLKNESVDVVMVTSEYNQRASDVIHALTAGKAVYVEKPLATTIADLEKIDHIVEQSTSPLCIDHYRLFSPLIERIREITDKRSGPLMIHYRMNVNAITKENMFYIDQGAGRIISDASHIIHLFCALIQAPTISVSVEAVHNIERNLFPTDNFMVVISFADGSLCHLTYTVLGNEGMGSERMELFVDGKSIILDDYTTLYGFGTPSWFNTTLSQPDKGQKSLLHAFLESLKQECYTPVFSWKELAESTRLTLLIDQLACQGGGSKG